MEKKIRAMKWVSIASLQNFIADAMRDS